MPAIGSPLKVIEPRGGTSPMMALSVVERPTPLRPKMLTISPAPTARWTPCRMWLLP